MIQLHTRLLPFITALFYSFSANAICAENGLRIFPSGATIKQNSIFVIDGYAQSQKVILGLNKAYPVYLKSGKQKIKLIITQINLYFYVNMTLITAVYQAMHTFYLGLEMV